MANIPQHRRTAAQFRFEAETYREAANANASHPETAASYLRLAERADQLAKEPEAEEGKSDPASQRFDNPPVTH
jgi:hypothetical protein